MLCALSCCAALWSSRGVQRLPRSCCRGTGSQTASTAACNFSWGQEGCVLKFPIVPAPSVPGPLQAITRPDRYWQQACGTTCKLEINPFDSLLCGQAAPSSCAEEKAPSQPWGRRRNCPVWAFRQRFTLCGHMRGGHGDTPTLLTDQIHFSLILENIIMQSLKNSSNILSCASGLYSCFFLTSKVEKYEVKEMAAWKWHLLWVINILVWPLSEYQIKEDSKDIDSMGIIISFQENTFSIK